jgi:hypothetical protein
VSRPTLTTLPNTRLPLGNRGTLSQPLDTQRPESAREPRRRRLLILPVSFFLVLALGCAIGSPANQDSDVASDDTEVDIEGTEIEGTDRPPADNDPIIITFSANQDLVNEEGRVVFTAVVTDPDGIDDLIGGVLTTADGDVTFGSFITAAAEGAYSLTLNLSDVTSALPDEFMSAQTVTFVGTFFDQGGREVSSEPVEVAFVCGGGNPFCDTQCTSWFRAFQECETASWECLSSENTNCQEMCTDYGEQCVLETWVSPGECSGGNSGAQCGDGDMWLDAYQPTCLCMPL